MLIAPEKSRTEKSDSQVSDPSLSIALTGEMRNLRLYVTR